MNLKNKLRNQKYNLANNKMIVKQILIKINSKSCF